MYSTDHFLESFSWYRPSCDYCTSLAPATRPTRPSKLRPRCSWRNVATTSTITSTVRAQVCWPALRNLLPDVDSLQCDVQSLRHSLELLRHTWWSCYSLKRQTNHQWSHTTCKINLWHKLKSYSSKNTSAKLTFLPFIHNYYLEVID